MEMRGEPEGEPERAWQPAPDLGRAMTRTLTGQESNSGVNDDRFVG